MSRHIILVDDDESLRYAFARTLTAAGYVVHDFCGYRGVIELLAKGGEADLLLIDISLPKGEPHGISVAGMVRQRRPCLPLIFITGHPEYAGYLPEDWSVLLKPIADDVLLTAVEAAIGHTPERH